jgi:hypothetical protein
MRRKECQKSEKRKHFKFYANVCGYYLAKLSVCCCWNKNRAILVVELPNHNLNNVF